MNILVSACLLGIACKYSGGDNACPRPARRPSAAATVS